MRAVDLGLVGTAARIAAQFELAYPEAIFTSGRRDAAAQASAMAENILQAGIGWIAATYARSPVRGACILAVQNLTTPRTRDGIAGAIHSVLSEFTDSDLALLSRHLGGLAFDVLPASVSQPARAWLDYHCALAGGKLLTCEGGLVRLHCEFSS